MCRCWGFYCCTCFVLLLFFLFFLWIALFPVIDVFSKWWMCDIKFSVVLIVYVSINIVTILHVATPIIYCQTYCERPSPLLFNYSYALLSSPSLYLYLSRPYAYIRRAPFPYQMCNGVWTLDTFTAMQILREFGSVLSI